MRRTNSLLVCFFFLFLAAYGPGMDVQVQDSSDDLMIIRTLAESFETEVVDTIEPGVEIATDSPTLVKMASITLPPQLASIPEPSFEV